MYTFVVHETLVLRVFLPIYVYMYTRTLLSALFLPDLEVEPLPNLSAGLLNTF